MKIDARIVDKMYLLRHKLKECAMDDERTTAGICFLGEKDDIIDTFVPILTSKGCWDCPAINHEMFYKGFMNMISKDRNMIGMALIKPLETGRLPHPDFLNNVRNLRKSFKDVTKTMWMCISDYDVITYRSKLVGKYIRTTPVKSNIYVNQKESNILRMQRINRLINDESFSCGAYDCGRKYSSILEIIENIVYGKYRNNFESDCKELFDIIKSAKGAKYEKLKS